MSNEVKEESTSPVDLFDDVVTPILHSLLVNDLPAIRREALVALGKVATEQSLDLLLHIAGSFDSDLRSYGCYALGFFGSARAKPILHEAIKEEYDIYLVFAAAESLTRLDDPCGLDYLLEGLDRKGIKRRIKTIKVLGELGQEKLIEVDILKRLRELLHIECYEQVRKEIVRSLGKIGTNQAANILIEALDDEDMNVKSEAALWLGRIGDSRQRATLLKIAYKKNLAGITATGGLLNDDQNKAFEFLNKLKKGKDPLLSFYCDKILLEFGMGKDLKRLKRYIDNQRFYYNALEALKELSSPDLSDELKGMCTNEDPAISLAAYQGLVNIYINNPSSSALMEMLSWVKNDSPEVRLLATKAIGDLSYTIRRQVTSP